MTDQNYDPTASGQRSGHSAYGNAQSADEPGSTSIYPDLGAADDGMTDQGLDDTSGVTAYGAGASAGTYGSSAGTYSGSAGTLGATTQTGSSGGATGTAKQVAGEAADRAADVKDTAVRKAGEVKDVALERGADVAETAKEELARLTGEARTQVRDLWSQASTQIREQADNGRTQLADLLHSLSGELGEMASKSTQSGPVTALAKQAAARGGELSHWLANSEPSAILNDVRRFARRRPLVFLGGAALAGVLVGRLGRSLMAVSQDESAPAHAVTGSDVYGEDITAGYTSGYPTQTSVPAVSTGELR